MPFVTPPDRGLAPVPGSEANSSCPFVGIASCADARPLHTAASRRTLADTGCEARHGRGAIKNWQRDDVLLVAFDEGTSAAGVFTHNRFCAAPVTVCRRHLAGAGRRSARLVVNAGNANAGTGE